MNIQEIELTNFKNYNKRSFKFNAEIVAVLGLNGMGKTNLLDAIYYTCIGKGFTQASDRNNVLKGQEYFRISTRIQKDKQDHVEIKVKPGKSKSISINGQNVKRISDHVGTYPVVMIAPMDIQILLEGSEARRLFLNNTIVQYDKEYLSAILVYNRLLQQRNALLKQFIERKYFDEDYLNIISDKMIEPAQLIHLKRTELIQMLSPLFESVYQQISGGNEQCFVTYRSELNSNQMKDLFQSNIQKDRVLGRTSSGIHRDDIKFNMNDAPLKTFASQGQLKSFVLAIKLAQYKLLEKNKSVKPILLLDDLFDKLDTNRVSYLLKMINDGSYGQVFISDTSIDRIPSILNENSVHHQVIKIERTNYEEEE